MRRRMRKRRPKYSRFKEARRPGRDLDYRGTRSPVDWSHLVHQVRTHKHGALEVLQDAINEWFPKQFAAAKAKASRNAYAWLRHRYYVGFSARTARQRFTSKRSKLLGQPSTAIPSPFIIRGQKFFRLSETQGSTFQPGPVAWIYSIKHESQFVTRGGRVLSRAKNPTGLTRAQERRAIRPKFTGSYKRPKIPVIHWAPRPDEETIVLHVRGPEAGTWAMKKQDILGSPWKSDDPDYAHTIIDDRIGWQRKARQQGYRNRITSD